MILLRLQELKQKSKTQIETLEYSTVTKGSGSWTKTIEQEGKNGKVKTYLFINFNAKWVKVNK